KYSKRARLSSSFHHRSSSRYSKSARHRQMFARISNPRSLMSNFRLLNSPFKSPTQCAPPSLFKYPAAPAPASPGWITVPSFTVRGGPLLSEDTAAWPPVTHVPSADLHLQSTPPTNASLKQRESGST